MSPRPAWILAALLLAAPARAQHKPPPPIPVLPLSIAVASEAGKPVQDGAWMDVQVAEAERLIGGAGVHLTKSAVRPLPDRFAHLENRKDRDALLTEAKPSVINVFIVASLRDVDDPRLYRMGVHWRPEGSPRRHYIIVAATARNATLAHELGHFFGNPHVRTMNNLMSYNHDGGEIFLDDKQKGTITRFARLYLRAKEILPAAPPEP